ncbi:IPExxxVDY family protein [Rasiella rasia]|uniref:IPExxxVDY family protein n=1 Tax=Rasiella rasia TaxID=2744027 RepID=A0A6G6GQ20_9FLAO|nr:IPExxxVDY family protein [Rasiella rasia]QIE59811.1 IPExxxVDY family protein [Rasiella rasia]
MAHYKLILEDDSREDFSLVAIHCSQEAYKMAFLLNQHVQLRLQRRRVDLDFSEEGLEITFPLFEFENQDQYTTYYLVANKCKTVAAHTFASGGLFGNDAAEEVVTKYLIPEYKKVDFFLKIVSEYETTPIRKLVMQLNEINQIISAFSVEPSDVKSKDNLIFD